MAYQRAMESQSIAVDDETGPGEKSWRPGRSLLTTSARPDWRKGPAVTMIADGIGVGEVLEPSPRPQCPEPGSLRAVRRHGDPPGAAPLLLPSDRHVPRPGALDTAANDERDARRQARSLRWRTAHAMNRLARLPKGEPQRIHAPVFAIASGTGFPWLTIGCHASARCHCDEISGVNQRQSPPRALGSPSSDRRRCC